MNLLFTIIECDCDPLSYLINIASVALTSAGIMQRDILSACSVVSLVFILIASSGRRLFSGSDNRRKE